MSRIVYVSGEYICEEEARISIFDRGFLFADAVYEVTAVVNGRMFDFEGHMTRLTRSCHELQLRLPYTTEDLKQIHLKLIEENKLNEGGIYLQVTRGSPKDRNFIFPDADVAPTLVLFTQSRKVLDTPELLQGIKVACVPDIRWKRRDIKTVQLLASSLAKMQALAAGADEAFMVEDGFITEGSSSNAYIITQDNVIVTRPLSNAILHGITRKAVVALIAQHPELRFDERPFTVQEAKAAKEAFITAATAFVTPVVRIDGQALGNGLPGPITRKLCELYLDLLKKEVGLL